MTNSIVISFRLSPSELAKGLDSLKLHDDTSSYRNLSSIVRSCYYHGITKLNPNPASPPSIESHNQVLALTRQGNSKQQFENILTDYDTEKATAQTMEQTLIDNTFDNFELTDRIKAKNICDMINKGLVNIEDNLTSNNQEVVRITKQLLNYGLIQQTNTNLPIPTPTIEEQRLIDLKQRENNQPTKAQEIENLKQLMNSK